ncbi:DNA-binding XRE family transcriptional regulator [Variovorax boronicumulans]|nr:helix-turn-helix transcriptional regulator [Variovorax boronicumulans]MDP9894905.1 DNA-binding XRE family transcriptional regulator [Variovorax boronicumulans]MDQ0054775.1 DNA-binding XRE family transcriptional regulator [Variovorax boronicumulans]
MSARTGLEATQYIWSESWYVEDRPWFDRTQRESILSMPIASPKHALDPALLALGTAIKALRKAHGLSQEELAHRSHIDRSYMSSIERGMQNPGVMTVVQIAAGIGVSVTELAAKARL